MINLDVYRFAPGAESTLGILSNITHGHEFLCFTLEDAMRDAKVAGETAIPNGTYEVELRTEGGFHGAYSKPDHWAYSFHKGMLWVRNVPGFEFILIHPGNHKGNTEGCLLVGNGARENVTAEGEIQSSRDAYRRIYPPIAAGILDGQRTVLTYRSA